MDVEALVSKGTLRELGAVFGRVDIGAILIFAIGPKDTPFPYLPGEFIVNRHPVFAEHKLENSIYNTAT